MGIVPLSPARGIASSLKHLELQLWNNQRERAHLHQRAQHSSAD